MNIDLLKKELETALGIISWEPSDDDIREIAERLKKFKGEPTKSNIEKIVLEVVGSCQCMSMEGLDNSDLNTLLILATKK